LGCATECTPTREGKFSPRSGTETKDPPEKKGHSVERGKDPARQQQKRKVKEKLRRREGKCKPGSGAVLTF